MRSICEIPVICVVLICAFAFGATDQHGCYAKQLAQAPASTSQPAPASSAVREQLDETTAEVARLCNENHFEEALPLAQKSLHLAEQLEPADVEATAAALLNFASIMQLTGQSGQARPMMERALKMLETAYGPNDTAVAVCLEKLGLLIKAQLDLESAEPYYQRALKIFETNEGADSPHTLSVLKDLVNLADARDKPEEGLALNLRIQKLYEQQKPLDEPEKEAERQLNIADNLNSQAAELIVIGKMEQAKSLLEQAIALRKKYQDDDNPDLIENINNLAMIHLTLEQPQEASALIKNAIEKSRKSLGPDSLTLAGYLNNLGQAAVSLGDEKGAREYLTEASKIIDSHVQKVLPNLSFAEQRQFLDKTITNQITLLLTGLSKGDSLKSAYELMFRWKGLLIEGLRAASKVQGLASNPQLAPKVHRLQSLRSQISAWFLQTGTMTSEDWKKHYDEMTSEKEALERELQKKLDSGSISDPLNGRSLSDVWASMKQGECLVDIYVYHGGEWRYAAIVSGPGVPPKLVDLGTAANMVDSMSAWQSTVLKGEQATFSWKNLCSTVWAPLAAALPSGTTKVWVCPDGEMFRLPWHLFSETDPRTAKVVVSQSDSIRELMCLWDKRKNGAAASRLLAVGGINFNATNAGGDSKGLITVPALPGTLKEVTDIENIAKSCNITCEVLTGDEATKSAVSKAMEQFSYIHLATHGIFVPENLMQFVRSARQQPDEPEKSHADSTPADIKKIPTRAIKVLPQYLRDRKSSRNPLVESALAFAGANRNSKTEGFSGFMTAEELLGLDLSLCKHLSLSACETARGKEITGQGVMGLRAAIMSAGVNSVLMSLWKVPDADTVQLMTAFYKNLWQKKMSATESLIEAQKELRSKPNAVPVLWQGWIVVGD